MSICYVETLEERQLLEFETNPVMLMHATYETDTKETEWPL